MQSQLTWTPAEPAVDEALCASFEELVSVEKPESCMTLPLPSPPLFGSFLPLWELLRLRLNSELDWISPTTTTPLPPLPSLLMWLLFSFRLTLIPGSHSRLIWEIMEKSLNIKVEWCFHFNISNSARTSSHSPGNYRGWLQTGNCTICAWRWHLVFEIRKGFDNQITKLQQGANLILKFLQRFCLIGVVEVVMMEMIVDVIIWSMGWCSRMIQNIHPRFQCAQLGLKIDWEKNGRWAFCVL